MKAPRFWLKPSGLALIMKPAARLYGWIVQRNARRPAEYKSNLPVICIGNVTMGGSGKTPVADAIAAMLQKNGAHPAILLRGYGGRKNGAFWVDPGMDALACGDEALLHARIAPTLVSADRAAGARMIEAAAQSTHIVMDDGLQNPALHKTLSLLVVDGGNPVGNGLVFPAGPLRETLEDAIGRVQGMIIMGTDAHGLYDRYKTRLPVFKAEIKALNGAVFQGLNVLAFAGIGRPGKFYQTLAECGAAILATRDFPDHYPYVLEDINALLSQAQQLQAVPVTTRKDWVRFPAELKPKVQVLDVGVVWRDLDAIEKFVTDLLPV